MIELTQCATVACFTSSVTTSSDAYYGATLRYLEQAGFAEKREPDAAAGER